MGNPKLKWTTEEEEALKKGVLKHGAGKWKIIQKDPEFNQVLFSRSNIDLKDKWRNLTVANGTGSGEKLKTPKAKANHVEIPAILPPSTRVAPAATLPHDPSADAVMKDYSRSTLDGSGAAKLNVMIFEALSTLNQPNGSDSSAIADSIKQKYEVPENFNRTLSCRLRRLVQQNKLEKVYFAQQDKQEKVRNFYRMKKSVLEDSVPVPHPRPPVKSQKDTQTRPLQVIGHVADETVEEAAVSAAYAIAEAENQSYVADKAVKEAERVSSMEEETESLLQFAMYCFEQSAQGEMMIMV